MEFSGINCKSCSLNGNPGPLVDVCKSADIMVVGLSAKVKKYNDEIPLDGRTRSGSIIDQVEEMAKSNGLSLYRTNLVKCAPLDENNKLRYPRKKEINKCLGFFEEEIEKISPKMIILLGDIVRKAVSKAWGIPIKKPDDKGIIITEYNGRNVIAIYHPSYVMRSKKRKEAYNTVIEQIIVRTQESM